MGVEHSADPHYREAYLAKLDAWFAQYQDDPAEWVEYFADLRLLVTVLMNALEETENALDDAEAAKES